MTILVFGFSGQVATELRRDPRVRAVSRNEADLSDPDACASMILQSGAEAVINAAAYTAVDQAEEEEELAIVINGTAPGAMAQAAASLGIPFVHISTDYVFDGAGQAAFAPDDPTGPIGAYGRSKLVGEEAVRAAGGTHAILRTSWVVSAHGTNFVKSMLRLGANRDRLTIVADQIGGPTCSRDIAAACLTICDALRDDAGKSGTYHFSGGPDVSWADFAREIFRQADLTVNVVDIPSSDYPTRATRPLNSRMDNQTTETVFGIKRTDWADGLKIILQDLAKQEA